MITFSRSLLSVASGILFLCALGIIGFYAAQGDQQGGSPAGGDDRPSALNSTASPNSDSETFVLSQPMGGMGGMGGGGLSGLPLEGGDNEMIIQNWEKPTGPAPSWLALGANEVRNEKEIAIRRALDKRIDIGLPETTLSEFLHTLGEMAGVHVIIDAVGLEEENVTPEEPVAIVRKEARVRDILRQVLQPLSLTIKVDLEAIVVTNRKNSANDIRFYDLSFILPDNGVTVDLIRAIETMIEPDSWIAAGGTSTILTVGSVLIVNAPQDTQDGIENLLREVGKQNAANLKPIRFKDKSAVNPTAKGSETPVVHGP